MPYMTTNFLVAPIPCCGFARPFQRADLREMQSAEGLKRANIRVMQEVMQQDMQLLQQTVMRYQQLGKTAEAQPCLKRLAATDVVLQRLREESKVLVDPKD